MLTASTKCMKYLLFISTFIFVLTGVFLIAIGIITKIGTQYEKYINEEYVSASNVLIFLGCFVFLVSFFGCCGAARESHCMIFTFSVLMASIFVAEAAIGITGYMLKGEASDVLTRGLNATMADYDKNLDTTTFWDTLQDDFSCCGTKSYTDWMPILHKLPMTCCGPKKGTKGLLTCTVDSPQLHKTPCTVALANIIKDNASTIGFTGLTIAVIQLVGVFMSCYLAHSIRNDYESV